MNGTQLEQQLRLEDYSVSNRGLRSGLVGTPARIAGQIADFERAGVDLLLLQFSPQLEEMERFAAEVMPLVSAGRRRGRSDYRYRTLSWPHEAGRAGVGLLE